MSVQQQHRVLRFAQNLSEPRLEGVSGESLLEFAGTIEKADLDAMSRAINSTIW
jgi:hypothetical protein